MRTEQVELYDFTELSEDVQEKVLSEFWDINVFDCWWDYSFEYIKEVGEHLGMYFHEQHKGEYFYFSLDRDYQFDFHGSIDLNDLNEKLETFYKEFPTFDEHYDLLHNVKDELAKCRRIFKWNFVDISAGIKNQCASSYCDYYNWEGADNSNVERLAEQAGIFLEELLKDFANFALEVLQNEWDYQTSEEAVKECLIGNEYVFLKDGTQWTN